MSFTYSGNPSTSPLDFIRFLLQDTDTNDQQFSNEEINGILSLNSGLIYTTAVFFAERLVAKYSRRVDKRVGDLSISYSQAGKQYQSLLQDLNNKATMEVLHTYQAGQTHSDHEWDRDDADLMQPSFRKGMHDNFREGGNEGDV